MLQLARQGVPFLRFSQALSTLQNKDLTFVNISIVTKYFYTFPAQSTDVCGIIPLTPELSSSSQRSLTRFFTGEFAS
jgi:hypothetical protein